MIGMLIFNDAGRQHDFRPEAPDDFGQLEGVGGAHLQMGVAIEFENSTVAPSSAAALSASETRCLGVPWLPASPREQMTKWTARPARVSRATTAATAEFEVVGMRAEGQQRWQRQAFQLVHIQGRKVLGSAHGAWVQGVISV